MICWQIDHWLLRGVLVAALWCGGLSGSVCPAQVRLATDRPEPHSPEESVELLRVPEGFRVEVVASEPHLADPVDIDFDARGRIFVAEIHGYNLEGYWEIVELNKTGVLDRKVRRLMDAPEEARKRAAKEQYGTVKLLEDTDGDGRVDKSSVWADRLRPCYGVVAARDGVIAVCPPDIFYLADRDGDGKAEVKQRLYGSGGGPMWNRPSNPRWNVNNWIYFDGGSRFKPDGSGLEPATGSGQFGQAVSDWGDRFFCVQVRPALHAVPLPYRYLARNPFYPAEANTESLFQYNRVYPSSQPHPWRLKRSQDPAWVKFYGAAEATANGFWTAACGPEIYRAAAFPPEYRGSYFICENAQNFINRSLLERDGAGYRIRRVPEDEQHKREFLTSTEQWFRPVNLTVGPDGALYIVDMYREIIEDYSAIPRFLQQQYVESLIAGSDRGRIYRVVAEETAGQRKFDLNEASIDELVGELSSSNPCWRQTAQRLLVERADPSAVGPLGTLVREGKTPQARLHALYTLGGLGALEPALVDHALGDSHYAVRVHSLRLSERWLDKSPDLIYKVFAMVEDPDPAVRLQLALTLGESKDPRAVEALGRLAVARADEKWMTDAILSSVADSADRLLGIILKSAGEAGKAARLVGPLAAVIGARHKDEEIGALLKRIAATKDGQPALFQVPCLEGLIEGLKRGKPKPLTSAEGQAALARLLGGPSSRVQELAVAVAGLVKLQEGQEFRKALEAAGKVALDEERAIKDRLTAIHLLRAAPFSLLDELAEELLDARQPLEVQLAAIDAVAAAEEPQVAERLLANWQSYTPKVRQAAVEAILGRKNRLPILFDAIQKNQVQASALAAMHRIQLTEHPDSQLRERAKSLLSGQGRNKGLEEIIARYRAALSDTRNVGHGKAAFEKHCAKCHKLQGKGFEVGPDLATIVNRADDTLVSDVLEPSREITVGFQNYTVVTEDGRIFTGVLAAETATGVKLRKEEAAEQTILRRDIDEMAASPLSMMPEGMEKEVSPQDLADLIAYLRQSLGPVSPPVATLFDDEPQLVQMLTSGSGSARLEPTDHFSGGASLAVTPPQRFHERIPGWEYRIAENPAPGQFRYIRFAWKSRAGEGVMIELAADGAWPPANQPLRRYYSGRNTTGWEAVEVSAQSPDQWIIVTRDLWKDFGSFTLTGIAPTAMGGEALFDQIELLRTLHPVDEIRSPSRSR